MIEYFPGDTPVVQATVTDATGAGIVPTSITVTVTDPAGASHNVGAPSSVATGVYQAIVTTVTLAGIYRVAWSATVGGDTKVWDYTFVVQIVPSSPTAPAPLPAPLFCTPQDVQDRCVRTLTAAELTRATVMIQDASIQIRNYTRRTFAQQQIMQTLRATSNILKLPQLPVISVDGIALIDYLGNSYAVPSFGFDGIDQIDLGYYSSVLNLPEDALSFGSVWSGSVRVTYTYGYNAIPLDVVSVCANMVARIFNTPGAGIVGVQLERIGPYEMRLGEGNGNNNSTGLTGVLTMTADDKATLAWYRNAITAVDLGR